MSTSVANGGSPRGSKDLASAAPPPAPTAASDSLLPPPANAAAAATGADDVDAGLSTQAYLEKTVMGVLALALEDVCRVRPTNPVDYLGSYLLRRSAANNTVEVTYEDTVPKPVRGNDEEA